MKVLGYITNTVGTVLGTIQKVCILVDETIDHARVANNETWGIVNDGLLHTRLEQQAEYEAEAKALQKALRITERKA